MGRGRYTAVANDCAAPERRLSYLRSRRRLKTNYGDDIHRNTICLTPGRLPATPAYRTTERQKGLIYESLVRSTHTRCTYYRRHNFVSYLQYTKRNVYEIRDSDTMYIYYVYTCRIWGREDDRWRCFDVDGLCLNFLLENTHRTWNAATAHTTPSFAPVFTKFSIPPPLFFSI